MLRGWWVNLFAAFRVFPRDSIIMLIFWVYFLLPIAFGGCAGNHHGRLRTGTGDLCLYCPRREGRYSGDRQRAVAGGDVSRFQPVGALWHIVLPQALRMMIPSFINQWIALD